MGCGASAPRVERAGGPQPQKKHPRANDDIVNSIRAISEFNQEVPLAIGALTIFDTKVKNVKEDYAFGKILGKGQFGTCRLVTEKATGTRFACKSIAKRRLATIADVEDVRREVQIMYHLAGHPNIVAIKEVYEDRSHVHLVEELCSGGELFDSIIERGHYSERDAAGVFRCIVSVIAHCHNMGVMHRDIKPENFLLSNRSKYATVKGTDFGLSCFFSEGQVLNEVVGSAFYVAPEVLRKRYDKRADIWSLGVLLYILLCGVPPFYAETEKDIFHAILSAELSFDDAPWPSISEAAKDVIRRMLDRNPARRATAAEVLAHEWVRENGSAAAAPLANEVLHRLQNFAALNKLQQEALKVIATHLPENEISGLKALFLEMDADGSGSITVDELREALTKKGTKIPAAELERIMAQADISGDGTLDYEEFLAATMNLAKLEHEEHLYMAFRFFDTDDSGYITREELTAALHRVCTQAEIDELLTQADSSGDGRIDYGEFCDLMRSGNSALAKATKTVKQGLMRTVRTQAVLDLARLAADIPPDTATGGRNCEPETGADAGPGGGLAPHDNHHRQQHRHHPSFAAAAAAGGGGGDDGGGGGSVADGSDDAVTPLHDTPAASPPPEGAAAADAGDVQRSESSGVVHVISGSEIREEHLPPIIKVTEHGMAAEELLPLPIVPVKIKAISAAADAGADGGVGGGACFVTVSEPTSAAVLFNSYGSMGRGGEPPTLVQQATPPRQRLVHAISAETEQHCKGALDYLEKAANHHPQQGQQPHPDLMAMAAVSFKSTVGG